MKNWLLVLALLGSVLAVGQPDSTRQVTTYATIQEQLRQGGASLERAEVTGDEYDLTSVFYNLNLTREVYFEDVHFRRKFSFKNVSFGGSAAFYGCTFEGQVYFGPCRMTFDRGHALRFVRCTFRDNVILFNADVPAEFEDCTFLGEENQFESVKRLEFVRCRFQIVPNPETAFQENVALPFLLLGESGRVTLQGCRFRADPADRRRVYALLGSQVDDLLLIGNDFGVPVLFTTTVRERLRLLDCRFRTVAGLSEASFPTENAHVHWASLRGKLSVPNLDADTSFSSEVIWSLRSGAPAFIPDADSSVIRADGAFEQAVAAYARLLAVYKARSDNESYNACYVAMRNLQTRRDSLDYRRTGGVARWVNWKLENFLRDKADYGTDYSKLIAFTLRVVLLFALLFFLQPSESDLLSRDRFVGFFQKTVQYFQSNKRLMRVFEEQQRQELLELARFRQMLDQTGEQVPAAIAWFGKPFYSLFRAFSSAALWALQHADPLPGRWVDQPPALRARLGVGMVVFFLGYVLAGIAMRTLNALTLSLNALTTLGYGEISARGAARYLVVLEGLIGWFLLTIFSVSLISQVMQ